MPDKWSWYIWFGTVENTGPYQMPPMPMNDRYMELSSDKLKFELYDILNLKKKMYLILK